MREADVTEATERGSLFYLIHELSRLTTAFFDKKMQSQGVTHAQWWMLMHLAKHEGATQIELAAVAGMGRAAAGELISRMEERGWVSRRGDTSDGRIKRVYLAEQANIVLKSMTLDGTSFFETALRDLSLQDLETTNKTLAVIKANLTAPEKL